MTKPLHWTVGKIKCDDHYLFTIYQGPFTSTTTLDAQNNPIILESQGTLVILQTEGKMCLLLGTIASPWEIQARGIPTPGRPAPVNTCTAQKPRRLRCTALPRAVPRPRPARAGSWAVAAAAAAGFPWPQGRPGRRPLKRRAEAVSTAGVWGLWAVPASLQLPSLVPGCARWSGLVRSPSTSGSADTSSSPSEPASDTTLAIAGRHRENRGGAGVGRTHPSAPEPVQLRASQEGHAHPVCGRGQAYLHSTVGPA